MRRLPDAYKKLDLGIIKKLIDLNTNLQVEKCRGRFCSVFTGKNKVFAFFMFHKNYFNKIILLQKNKINKVIV